MSERAPGGLTKSSGLVGHADPRPSPGPIQDQLLCVGPALLPVRNGPPLGRPDSVCRLGPDDPTSRPADAHMGGPSRPAAPTRSRSSASPATRSGARAQGLTLSRCGCFAPVLIQTAAGNRANGALRGSQPEERQGFTVIGLDESAVGSVDLRIGSRTPKRGCPVPTGWAVSGAGR